MIVNLKAVAILGISLKRCPLLGVSMSGVGQKVVFDHKLQSTIAFGIDGVFIRTFNRRKYRHNNAV